MKSSLPEEIQAFRDGRPEVGDYPASARARAQIRLARAATGTPRTGTPGAAARRLGARAAGRRWVRLGLAGCLGAGAAVAVTLAVLPGQSAGGMPGRGGGPHAEGTREPAARVLALAAATAAGQAPPASPVAGQYAYIKQIYNKGGTAQRCSTVAAVEWMSPAGSGRATQTSTSQGCGAPITQTWRAGAIPRDTSPDAWPANLHAWLGLPVSPAALQRAIVRRYEHGHPLASATFVYAGELLELDAPPALRSALFQVMKLLPGVQDLGPATDRLGRYGIAVGLDTGGVRSELIFSPATSRALEYQQVAVPPRQSGNNFDKPGTLFGYTVYVSTGVVNGERSP